MLETLGAERSREATPEEDQLNSLDTESEGGRGARHGEGEGGRGAGSTLRTQARSCRMLLASQDPS